MRKILTIILASFLVLTTLFFNNVFALTPPFQEEIQQLDTSVTVNSDGSISVVETINYFFPSAKHGIFREIPLNKTNSEGKEFKMSISNLSVKDNLGSLYQYTESEQNEVVTLKIGDPNKTVSGNKIYVISYEIKGALTYYSDHDELYWNAPGNSWPVPILASSSTIILPANIDPSQISSVCYTGEQSSTASNCATRVANNNVSTILLQPLSAS